MASKKGIAITIIILAAITGASFLVWTIPQQNETTFIVTDYENYLDGVKEIHEILQKSTDIEFQRLLDGEITPEQYIETAEVTSSQVTSQIGEFVTSKPPEEWQDSYISYMDAMRKFSAYIGETKVVANLIENESSQDEISEVMKKIESLKAESAELVKISDDSRPD
ncbi:hypothetical protein AAA799E16_00961 [Marine Group I thaumarchaeote SCGC AAA799-E16]|uniref:Chemotaxis methyl-accepting receptor HlyB-like 4HB MCP domain-containing protein n=4 Tax=Marine Group I TaxID=905826 RepID=A0A081RNJ1_9ARCH|nr:hypothetical protein AAA799N04_00797 [Marine Group I thaumarchaeote SCGC AAA799-N04]KER06302.1 hypothetical protein AAA799E16_00961 [Marine Group I thaumarchaeote SCGC AAA799-E16]KFM15472.1 hypothetical protein AAA799D11_01303 [Marine Group I thaumarchaeote SCGC AAA799-D11]KFM16714.1 hypothetical protein SCCGRSA3_02157 [Marine Group I thaumarchaeote SCGC RSA3]